MGEKGAQCLANSLRTNRQLTHLWLYDEDIGTEGAKALGACIKVFIWGASASDANAAAFFCIVGQPNHHDPSTGEPQDTRGCSTIDAGRPQGSVFVTGSSDNVLFVSAQANSTITDLSFKYTKLTGGARHLVEALKVRSIHSWAP